MDSIAQKLADGVPPSRILAECVDDHERAAAFEVICQTPVREVAKGTPWQHGLLIMCFGVMALLYVVALGEALLLGQNPVPPAIGVVGSTLVVNGFRRRRLWAYVGAPVWSAFIALGELRGMSQDGGWAEPGDVFLLIVMLGMLGTAVILAVRLRRRLFPFSSWRGLRRDAEGALVVPQQIVP